MLELRPFGRGHGVSPRPHPFALMSPISALLESCSLAPAPRPLPSNTHFKFVLGQFDIAEAAGCIGTGPNRPQRLYNGRCEQLVAPDGLESAAGSPYSQLLAPAQLPMLRVEETSELLRRPAGCLASSCGTNRQGWAVAR